MWNNKQEPCTYFGRDFYISMADEVVQPTNRRPFLTVTSNIKVSPKPHARSFGISADTLDAVRDAITAGGKGAPFDSDAFLVLNLNLHIETVMLPGNRMVVTDDERDRDFNWSVAL